MINSFQRILYVLGTISPYSIIASISLAARISISEYQKWIDAWTKVNTNSSVTLKQQIVVLRSSIPCHIWIIIKLSIVILIYHIMFLKISLRNLSRMDFHASSTPEEKDEFALGLGAAYLLPIIEWIVTENIFDKDEQISMWFLLAIGIIAFFICLFANKSYGSPVYWLMGYHFHNVQFEGGKPYVLMSKTRSFRNKRQIKRVIRLFEDFLIDVS